MAKNATQHGHVSLVGAGPGDPRLISIRGLDLLKRADVVLYDALVHPGVMRFCRPDCERVFAGKRAGAPSIRQDKINQQLLDYARAGKQVVRLKGGDPMLFSRGSEEAELLADHGVSFEIVPAPASPLALAAYAGIPLTHRELSSSVAFITATESEEKDRSSHDWSKLANATETLVIFMGLRKLDSLMKLLVEHGRNPNTPVAVVEWASLPAQRVVQGTVTTIAKLAHDAGLKMPATTIVGEVVRLREKLNWFERLPLFGKRVLVPRPLHQSLELCARLRERGAEPIAIPLLTLAPPESSEALRTALTSIRDFNWLVMTSANAVQYTFQELQALNMDARALGNTHVAAMGQSTAIALRTQGIVPDLIADESTSEGLASSLLKHAAWKKGAKILVPQADNARSVLVDALRDAGNQVQSVVAYRNLPMLAEDAERLKTIFSDAPPDAVLFTAGSTVRNLMRALSSEAREKLKKTVLVAIGPVTADAMRAAQLEPNAVAETTDDSGLVDALQTYYTERSSK